MAWVCGGRARCGVRRVLGSAGTAAGRKGGRAAPANVQTITDRLMVCTFARPQTANVQTNRRFRLRFTFAGRVRNRESPRRLDNFRAVGESHQRQTRR